jgi:A/G-specific adenine glycosylase
MSASGFARAVIKWQRAAGRHDLPWQVSRDPYRVWLAEIMLQQTQVATVIPYYLRFIDRFVDVRALAAAPLDAVMTAWAGLGYYTRARNLHRCAQRVVEQHGGLFPTTAAQLQELPGIGRSTAAAIAALAFGERVAILDGNVKRVLARCFAVDGDVASAPVARKLWQLAESLTPAHDIGPYTQGLMDLGATVCTRHRPRCGDCPLAADCVARRDNRVTDLPAARTPRVRPQKCTTVLVVRDDTGAVLVEARPPTGIWGGLASLPEFEASASDAALIGGAAARYGIAVRLDRPLPEVRHEFTHYTLLMRPRLARATTACAAADHAARFVGRETLDATPLPAPIRRLLLEVFAADLEPAAT